MKRRALDKYSRAVQEKTRAFREKHPDASDQEVRTHGIGCFLNETLDRADRAEFLKMARLSQQEDQTALEARKVGLAEKRAADAKMKKESEESRPKLTPEECEAQMREILGI